MNRMKMVQYFRLAFSGAIFHILQAGIRFLGDELRLTERNDMPCLPSQSFEPLTFACAIHSHSTPLNQRVVTISITLH